MKRRMWIALLAGLVLSSLAASAQATAGGAQQRTEIARLFAKNHVKDHIVKPPKGQLKYPYLVPSGR